jgi:hypothetical protein
MLATLFTSPLQLPQPSLEEIQTEHSLLLPVCVDYPWNVLYKSRQKRAPKSRHNSFRACNSVTGR